MPEWKSNISSRADWTSRDGCVLSHLIIYPSYNYSGRKAPSHKMRMVCLFVCFVNVELFIGSRHPLCFFFPLDQFPNLQADDRSFPSVQVIFSRKNRVKCHSSRVRISSPNRCSQSEILSGSCPQLTTSKLLRAATRILEMNMSGLLTAKNAFTD